MKVEDIDVDSAINSVKELLKKEKDLSPAFRSALEVLLLLVALLPLTAMESEAKAVSPR
ncbi:MAG: hypothetical protein AB2814_06510 [Candidatus Sedimenticola endophacoides]